MKLKLEKCVMKGEMTIKFHKELAAIHSHHVRT